MATSSKPRAHAGFLLANVRLADRAGVASDEFLRAHNISPTIRNDADASVSIPDIHNFFRDVTRDTGDEDFFWKNVLAADPEEFGYYGHLAIHAPTLGDAYRAVARNIDHLVPQSIVEIAENDGLVSVCYSLRDDGTGVCREESDAIAALAIAIGRRAHGPGWCPARVFLEHAAPASLGAYRGQCASDFVFNAPGSGIAVERADLLAAMPGADIYVQRAIESYVEEVISKSVDYSLLALNVRRTLTPLLPDGVPPVAEVANRLGMSARTLQRRLNGTGTSYSDVLEALRQDLAERMLSNRSLSISEIAYLLGYAELSSFDRAYRSWTGRTPADVRREKFAA